MTIEVTRPAPRGEHLLDERLKDETLNSLREPTWLITKEGQGMISGPEDVMEDNLFEYLNARENEGDQLNELYNFMLKNANKMGESFPGYLNRHHKNEEVSENYNLFMQKYGGDMQDFENFGEEKDVTDFIDPFLLDELKQQKNILNRIGNDRLEGIPSGEMQRLANGGPTAGGGADQEFVNQRIAELMMEEPTGAGLNEMRATNPDMFERQKLGIERLLSNLYEPRRARDIAETISTGMDFTPLGDPAAIAEGFQMMGDGQPFMGAALMAGSVFSNLPSNTIKTWLKTVKDKLDTDVAASIYDAENFIRQPSRGDRFQGRRMLERARAKENELLNLEKELQDALENPEFSLSELDDPIKSLEGRPTMNEVLEGVKTPEQMMEIRPMLNNLRNNRKLSAVPESGTKEPDFFQSLAESNPSFKKMLIEGRKDAGYIKPVSSGKEFEDVQKELFDRIMNLELSETVANNPKLRQMAVDLIKRSPTMSQKELDMLLKVLESPRMTPSQTRFLMQFDSLTRGNQPKQVKGIINATPETQKLYQELLDSPSAINTPRHNKVGKDASEQLREIKKQVEESDLEDRNEVLRLLAQLRDKKPK